MLDRAISEFQEAARLNPDNPAYIESLAKPGK
jgi:cytochrome c-type biogenesis protein CcmH/NrfG